VNFSAWTAWSPNVAVVSLELPLPHVSKDTEF
jgi:hypothetical protein